MMPIWLRIVCVLLIQLLLTALVLMGLEGDVADWWRAICLALLAVQVTVLPTFAAMVPWHIGMLRLPMTLFLLALLWLVFVISLRISNSWFIPQIAMVFAATVIWGYVIVFVGVRLASWLSGWQLAFSNRMGGETALGQFRIAHMLAVTAGIAILLGLGRVVLPKEDWSLPPLIHWDLLIGAGIMAPWVIVNTALIVPVSLWGSSLHGGALAAFSLATPLCLALATLSESVVLHLLNASDPDAFPILLTFNLAQAVFLVVLLKMLRWAGWHLTRVPKPASETKETQPPSFDADGQLPRDEFVPDHN